MLDQKRVAEIWVPSTSERGSGYVLCQGCLLTAFHVVKGSAQIRGQKDIEFRLLGDQSQWLNAEILWKDEGLDLALLQFTEALPFPAPLPKVASQDFTQRRDCDACGFPSFGVVTDYKRTVCQEYRAEGWIKPTDLTATKNPGRLLMEIEGAIPIEMTDWKGISGSAVFSTEGSLLGVILDGPENLQGQQIHLISLGWVLQKYPGFNEQIKNTFQQCLEFYDPIAMNARDRYLKEIEIRQIEAQEVCAKAELADYEARKARFSRDFDTLPPIDRNQIDDRLPERQLEIILETLDKRYPQMVREVWHHTASSRLSKASDIQSIHALLLGTKDSILLSRFLSTLIHQLDTVLQTGDRSEEISSYIAKLTEIAQKLGQKLETTLVPQALQTQSKTTTKETTTTLILLKLKEISTTNQTTEYTLNLYKIPDSQAYQTKVKEELPLQVDPLNLTPDQLQSLNLEFSNQTLTFSLDNSENLENDLKDKLADIIQAVFETYSNLTTICSQILFYVSKPLISIDFHNLDCDRDGDDWTDTLGCKFPVSVSCLDRYDLPPQKRDSWSQRWDALDKCCQHSLNHYLKPHDLRVGNKPLDLGNIKILRNQLREMDTEGVRTLGSDFQVVGIHFNHLDQDFRPIYSKLFSTGLSLFLLPSAPLKPEEIDRINEVLEKSPTHFLTALRQEYRVKAGYDTGSAGSLSVLMDNPYLPLPDIEYA